MAHVSYSYADYDGEISSVKIPTSDLTAANFDAQAALRVTFQAAMEAVLRGLLLSRNIFAKVSPMGVGRGPSAEGQREEKALVRYYDSVTFERKTLEIPCVDMTKQNTEHPGYFFIDGGGQNHADWEDFVVDFEAYVLPDGWTSAVVEEIVHVGRNI